MRKLHIINCWGTEITVPETAGRLIAECKNAEFFVQVKNERKTFRVTFNAGRAMMHLGSESWSLPEHNIDSLKKLYPSKKKK